MAKYITKQRKILQEYLSQRLDLELSAKQVAEDLADQNVSLSAIYRNLSQMEAEQQVVFCYKEGSRELFFRYINGEDCASCLHISCKICHETNHLSEEESRKLRESMKENYQFHLDFQTTVFYGICKTCQQMT